MLIKIERYCKHYVCGDDGYYSCEKWNCEFESKEVNGNERKAESKKLEKENRYS